MLLFRPSTYSLSSIATLSTNSVPIWFETVTWLVFSRCYWAYLVWLYVPCSRPPCLPNYLLPSQFLLIWSCHKQLLLLHPAANEEDQPHLSAQRCACTTLRVCLLEVNMGCHLFEYYCSGSPKYMHVRALLKNPNPNIISATFIKTRNAVLNHWSPSWIVITFSTLFLSGYHLLHATFETISIQQKRFLKWHLLTGMRRFVLAQCLFCWSSSLCGSSVFWVSHSPGKGPSLPHLKHFPKLLFFQRDPGPFCMTPAFAPPFLLC